MGLETVVRCGRVAAGGVDDGSRNGEGQRRTGSDVHMKSRVVLAMLGVVAGGGLVTFGLYLAWAPLAYIFAGACFIVAGLFTESSDE